ncbi:hypothetical protein [Nocardioides massiliensis]|uniref:DUF5666 domain-containing protein n=1 Tax=Nocardioides massiliensis TaxID=1325935 RepID=A0ABT9NS10_9ACTN|nr:hypothetical protein [Nocardioides massiliensis]MDP9822840.1 hypothetical protein [Nocardioides massiliensis]
MKKWLFGGTVMLLLAFGAGIAISHAGSGNPVATYAGDVPTFLAGASGTLVLEDGCLYLRGQGTRRLPIFHDEEVAWNRDSQELTYLGEKYRLGDYIDLMGGVMDLREVGGLRLPRGCAPENPFAVAPSR